MSEKLKASSGEALKGVEFDPGVSSLEAMADEFDPEAAEKLRATKKETKETSSFNIHLASKEELEADLEDLSPEDAANEYLTLLDELSQDFTNPNYNSETRSKTHYVQNITTDLGKKYSKNPHYRWVGYASTEAGETDGTMLRIASADYILAHEIKWRDESEKLGGRLDVVRGDMARLDADYAAKSGIGKFFGRLRYERRREKLENQESKLSWETVRCNHNMAKELAIVYNESGNYDYDPKNNDHGEVRNEERNRRFFGFDDPKRAAKIERAIALRRKYESEWTEK